MVSKGRLHVHISRPVIEKLQGIGIYVFFGGDWLVQNCKGAKLYQGVVQQLRGTNFTQSKPPIPLEWIIVGVLHTKLYFVHGFTDHLPASFLST